MFIVLRLITLISSVLVSLCIFLFIPCGRLSWLSDSFLLPVKYTVPYRIVSYLSYRIILSLSLLCLIYTFICHRGQQETKNLTKKINRLVTYRKMIKTAHLKPAKLKCMNSLSIMSVFLILISFYPVSLSDDLKHILILIQSNYSEGQLFKNIDNIKYNLIKNNTILHSFLYHGS